MARLGQHDPQREDLLSELRPPLDLQMLRQDYVVATPMERESLLKSARDGDAAMLDELLNLGFSGDLSCFMLGIYQFPLHPGDGN